MKGIELSTSLNSEIRDESNELTIMSRKFPLVGCDRRAPPAKVGIVMSRDKLTINAYARNVT